MIKLGVINILKTVPKPKIKFVQKANYTINRYSSSSASKLERENSMKLKISNEEIILNTMLNNNNKIDRNNNKVYIQTIINFISPIKFFLPFIEEVGQNYVLYNNIFTTYIPYLSYTAAYAIYAPNMCTYVTSINTYTN